MLDNELAIYEKHGKFGIGKTESIDFIYDSIYHPRFEEYIILQKDNKWGACDTSGTQILPFDYEAIRLTRYRNSNEKGMFYVKKDGKLGTVDINNQTIIPLVYDDISRLNEHNPGAHYVVKNGKTGISSFDGKIIIPIEYDSLYYYHTKNLIKAKKGKLVGVLDSSNKIILPFKYQNIIFDFYDPKYPDDDGILRFVVRENDEWSIVNLKGKKLKKNISEEALFKEYSSSQITNYDFKYATICLIDKTKNYR